MSELIDYIQKHIVRGACTCGRCIDAPENPEEKQPNGHTANVHFFKVALQGEPDAEKLKELIKSHGGVFNKVDLFDGKEHNYMELGGWIGDQGLALTLMGMGEILNLWELLTPEKMMPQMPDMWDMLAGNGMVAIKVEI